MEARCQERGILDEKKESVDKFGNVRMTMTPAGPSPDATLDLLLEAIDTGVVPTLPKTVSSKVEFRNQQKVHG